jgi:hypothetical protein
MDTEKMVKKWLSAAVLLLLWFAFSFPSRYDMAEV